MRGFSPAGVSSSNWQSGCCARSIARSRGISSRACLPVPRNSGNTVMWVTPLVCRACAAVSRSGAQASRYAQMQGRSARICDTACCTASIGWRHKGSREPWASNIKPALVGGEAMRIFGRASASVPASQRRIAIARYTKAPVPPPPAMATRLARCRYSQTRC